MFLSANWASEHFPEPTKNVKSSMEAMLDDIIRRNGKYMVDMVLPSDTKGHPYIPGSVFTTKVKESHLYASINNHTVTVYKTGDIWVQGKRVPKHELKLLRDPTTGVVSRHRCLNWLENYRSKEQFLTFMNGAQTTMPNFNRNRLLTLINEARLIASHAAIHRFYYGMFYRSNVNTFSPVLYF